MDQMTYCLDLLRRLVAIPSQSQQEEAVARFLERFLRDELGMEAELFHVEGNSYNVRGQWRRENAPRRLILGGHIDTVPPTSRWTADPYCLTVQDGVIRGLGAGDMKGGLAAQLTVLKQLRDERLRLNCDVEFVGLADEERFSTGANAYVEMVRKENRPQQDVFFLMAEPHYDNIVIGAAGKILERVDIQGTGGHASTPELGINAVDCMAEFLTQVRRKYQPLYARGERASHCCLRVESDYPGYSLNIPEHCFCLLNKQLLPQEDGASFEAELRQLYEAHVGQGEITVSRQIPSYPSYQLSPQQKDLASLLDFLDKRFQHRPELRINQSVSDGNILYHELGIPTVLYGPQGVAFHTEREHLLQDSLEAYMEQLLAYIKLEYMESPQE